MSEISEIQEKADQVNYNTAAGPAPGTERRSSLSSTMRATDRRRYRIALGISLTILLALLIFGFVATLP